MAASATTATEMNEPNIVRKDSEDSERRESWMEKDIEAWDVHLHT